MERKSGARRSWGSMPRYSRPVPGDGLLALSGAQSAGKPDPENAVRVALGAQAAVQAEEHSPRYEQGGTVVAKARRPPRPGIMRPRTRGRNRKSRRRSVSSPEIQPTKRLSYSFVA